MGGDEPLTPPTPSDDVTDTEDAEEPTDSDAVEQKAKKAAQVKVPDDLEPSEEQ